MARRSVMEGRAGAGPKKVAVARELRRDMTAAERALWTALRGGALGFKVRAQHVIRGWIVDFYVASAGLVIELDGGVHDAQREEDERRTAALAEENLRVIRFRNEEVLDELPRVIERIVDAVTAQRS